MSGDYAFWRAALEGHKPKLTVGDAHCGFWRMRETRGGPFIPVAVWRDKARLVRKIGDANTELVLPDWAETAFPFVSMNPVSETAYRHRMDTGAWPDDPPSTNSSNNPPPDVTDDFTALCAEIDAEKIAINDWLKGRTIKTQEEADTATNWIAKIAALDRRRDEMFQSEKRPVRELAASIDAKFRPLRDGLDLLIGQLKQAQTPFLRAELKRKQDEQEAARQRAIKEQVPVPAKVAAPVRANSGTSGRKVGLIEKRTGKITDKRKFVEHLLSVDYAEFDEFLQSVADKFAHAKVPIVGMEIVKEMVPR